MVGTSYLRLWLLTKGKTLGVFRSILGIKTKRFCINPNPMIANIGNNQIYPHYLNPECYVFISCIAVYLGWCRYWGYTTGSRSHQQQGSKVCCSILLVAMALHNSADMATQYQDQYTIILQCNAPKMLYLRKCKFILWLCYQYSITDCQFYLSCLISR